MPARKREKSANLSTGLHAAAKAAKDVTPLFDVLRYRRELVADLCRLLDPQAIRKPVKGTKIPQVGAHAQQLPNLSPRMRQTLTRLLAGDSEKQIAIHLGVSKNTVHVYVKALYKGFDVCSRGELLSKFVVPSSIFAP